MAPVDASEMLLQPPANEDYPTPGRTYSAYNPLRTFHLAKGEQKHYQQQYADMYFARLAVLKPAVERIANEAWDDFEIAGEKAKRVERVLDVRQGQLCWVIGTVYMEMPLKPNIMDDISKDHWVAAPRLV
ncbi:DNA polymerase delta small subunit Cdc1 [Taxawa tesnikishii (nom. ined.)]|nr:DNA polymerase delta small subunit Cdc1 [Dothideales sp. JES 119]